MHDVNSAASYAHPRKGFFFSILSSAIEKKGAILSSVRGLCTIYWHIPYTTQSRPSVQPNGTAVGCARRARTYVYGVEEKKLPHHVYFNIAIVAERTRWGVSTTIGCREDECTTPAMIAYHSVGMLAGKTGGCGGGEKC